MKSDVPRQNRLDRIVLLGVEEIIGPDNAGRLFGSNPRDYYSDPGLKNAQESYLFFKDLSQVQACLEKEYSFPAGRGLAVRAGRACFKYILHEFGQELGLTGNEFRLLPLAGRLSIGGGSLVKLINQYTPLNIEQKLEGDFILWNIDHPLEGGDLQANSPACQFAIGILQEALYWFSGGKTFQVDEKLCVCQGSPFCSIRIRKKPIQK